jgi:polyhydroxyalkanoate synthase
VNKLLKQALHQGLQLNERFAASAVNGFDWMFRRGELVKSGLTWFDYAFVGELMKVRHYDLRTDGRIDFADGSSMPIEQETHLIPLLLVPPLGVIADTFDLMPDRSLVRYMAARGFKVYMIDWGTPTRAHARLRLQDYADRMMNQAIEAVLKHSGAKQVSLMGWCMGGLLSLMQAGLKRDARIANIVTIASPIDTRQGSGVISGMGRVINTPAKLMRKVSDFRLLNVDPQKMHIPGWMTTLMFKMTDPIGSVTTYWDLLMGLWDREFVETHSTTADYLNNMLAYPAGVMQDMLVRVTVDNKLAKGEIRLGSKVSRFANIHAPLYVFAGKSDALVSSSTARAIIDLVSSVDKRFEVAPGGHMGVILGSKARENVWKSSADWLAERSSQESTLSLPKAPRKTKATPTVKVKAPTGKAAAMPKASALPKSAAQKPVKQAVGKKAGPSKLAASPTRVRKTSASGS